MTGDPVWLLFGCNTQEHDHTHNAWNVSSLTINRKLIFFSLGYPVCKQVDCFGCFWRNLQVCMLCVGNFTYWHQFQWRWPTCRVMLCVANFTYWHQFQWRWPTCRVMLCVANFTYWHQFQWRWSTCRVIIMTVWKNSDISSCFEVHVEQVLLCLCCVVVETECFWECKLAEWVHERNVRWDTQAILFCLYLSARGKEECYDLKSNSTVGWLVGSLVGWWLMFFPTWKLFFLLLLPLLWVALACLCMSSLIDDCL